MCLNSMCTCYMCINPVQDHSSVVVSVCLFRLKFLRDHKWSVRDGCGVCCWHVLDAWVLNQENGRCHLSPSEKCTCLISCACFANLPGQFLSQLFSCADGSWERPTMSTCWGTHCLLFFEYSLPCLLSFCCYFIGLFPFTPLLLQLSLSLLLFLSGAANL